MAKLSENSPLAMELEMLKFNLREPVQPMDPPEPKETPNRPSTPAPCATAPCATPEFAPEPEQRNVVRVITAEEQIREDLISEILENRKGRK